MAIQQHQAARPAALAQIPAHWKRTRLDDDLQDARNHAAHLQGRHPARAGGEKSRAARGDALHIQLQGYRHHPTADVGHH